MTIINDLLKCIHECIRIYDGKPPYSRHVTAAEFYLDQAATLATIRTAAATSTMTAAEAAFSLQALDGLERYFAARRQYGGGSGLATARKLIIEAQAIATGSAADPARMTGLLKLAGGDRAAAALASGFQAALRQYFRLRKAEDKIA